METLEKQTQPKSAQQKAEHLHIRASERDKKTLSQAAQLKNLSISQFLLQLALPVAEEILKTQAPEMDEVQTVFALEDAAWQEFNRLLDAPPRELPELQKLLASRPIWEASEKLRRSPQ